MKNKLTRYKVRCVKGDDVFILTFRAISEQQALQRAYAESKCDDAMIHNEKFEGTMQRKTCGYHHTYRRSSMGRAGQVIFS